MHLTDDAKTGAFAAIKGVKISYNMTALNRKLTLLNLFN